MAAFRVEHEAMAGVMSIGADGPGLVGVAVGMLTLAYLRNTAGEQRPWRPHPRLLTEHGG